MAKAGGTPLHQKILYGMVTGAGAGLVANWVWGPTEGLQDFVRTVTYPAGQIFLRLIFMVVIPLIFSALVLGVAELGDVRRLGRVGLKMVVFTLVLSSLSVLIGITLGQPDPARCRHAGGRQSQSARDSGPHGG